MNIFQRVLAISAILVLAAAVSVGSPVTFTQMNGLGTYGTPSGGGTNSLVPGFIALSSYGSITPGVTQISITAVGDICFDPGSNTCPGTGYVNVSGISSPIIAGFSNTNSGTTFIASGQTAINTGGGGTGDWTADYSNDFVVTSSGTGFFTVPLNANYIIFAFRDSLYQDNVANSNFGVNVNIQNPGVPEPATAGLFLTGLGALIGLGRRFRRS